MKRFKAFAFITLFLATMILAIACADKESVTKLEKTQNEILTRLNTLEENQKKILSIIPPQRLPFDYNKVYNLPIGASPVKGDMNGAVTITEFSDFQCPYCAQLQATLNEVINAYPTGVKLVFKNFPLQFHKQAKNAAKASLAAGEQGKFWEMHNLLFENFSSLEDKSYKTFAERLKLDMGRFTSDFNSNKYDQLIQQDITLGGDADVRGTPTLFINGKRMQNRSFDDFKAAIDEALKKQ
ncbi:MAG: DsbA family protein [Nitrospirae bacterium]|nr:DsbA family protein [Nitrospirota bacterium]